MFLYWGGYKVYWGNKTCKYVHKYFFVFLSIQFLRIVFLSTANSLQTTNYLIFFFFFFFQIFSEDSGCWMRKGVSSPVHPWIHFLSQAGAPVLHLLLGLLLLPVGQGSPSERLQLPLSLYWRAVHSGDTQYQCLFGLLHPFLCPALLWLEGHGWFHYFTIRIILLGKGGPWIRNHLHFRFQGEWWCFMHLQTWLFLDGSGVRGCLRCLSWGVAGSSSFPGAFACLPVR